MPNWKKVITSGSDAALNSVTATAGFTGSLLGNASTATTATNVVGTANRILYNSGTNTTTTSGNLRFDGSTLEAAALIVPGNATVTGSAQITGSLLVRDGLGTVIDTTNYNLVDGAVTSVAWGARKLRDTNNFATVDWEGLYLSSPQGGGVVTVEWGSGQLNDTSTSQSVDWEQRMLLSNNATKALDYSDNLILMSPRYQTDYKTQTLQEEVSSNTPGNVYSGDIIQGRITASAYPNEGRVVYLRSDGTWRDFDQANSSFYGSLVGIIHNVNTGTDTCDVLLEGHVLVEGTNTLYPMLDFPKPGAPVYHNEGQVGEMSSAKPNTGIVQILGHCYYQNTSNIDNFLMKFKPSSDWYSI